MIDGSDLVALGSLLLVGFLAWRGRTGTYREKLYERQLDALTSITGTAMDLHDTAMGAMGRELRSLPMDDDARGRVRIAIVERWNEHATNARRLAIFIPKPVAAAHNAYEQALFGTTAIAPVAGNYPPRLVGSADPQADIHRALLDIVTTTREALGVDKLGAELEGLLRKRR